MQENIFNNFISEYRKIVLFVLCFYISDICRHSELKFLNKIRNIIMHEDFFYNEKEVWFDDLKISNVEIGYFENYYSGEKLAIKIYTKSGPVPSVFYASYHNFDKMTESDLTKLKVKAIIKIDNWISELTIEKEERINIIKSEEYKLLCKSKEKLNSSKYFSVTQEPRLNT